VEVIASIKIKNQGSGLKNRPFVIIYSSPSFDFTIIRPITKILSYGKKTKFEIIVIAQNNNHKSKKDRPPNLLICNSGFEKKVTLEPKLSSSSSSSSAIDNDYRFEEGIIYYSADVMLNYKGIWRIGYETASNSYGFLAEYE